MLITVNKHQKYSIYCERWCSTVAEVRKVCQTFLRLKIMWAGKHNIDVGLEGLCCSSDIILAAIQFGNSCSASWKCADSLTERLNLWQRQLKGCSAIISHAFVQAQFLYPTIKVAGLVSNENRQFYQVLTQQKVSTINQAMGVAESSMHAKKSRWWVESKYDMLSKTKLI